MSESKKMMVFVDERLCKGVDGCGICIHVCPKDVYERSKRLTPKGIRPPEVIRPDECSGCKLCMIYCPDLAIVIEKEKNI
jgi:2-oxoglutarate ferredoxin oxidoreductase subunit delta